MNTKQLAAAKRLGKSLDACHKAGLMGGVYDGAFYVWPSDAKPDPRDSPHFGFFVALREESGGDMIETIMSLDGGAGV